MYRVQEAASHQPSLVVTRGVYWGPIAPGMGDTSDAVHNKSAKDALAELRAGIAKMSTAGSVQPQDQADFALSRVLPCYSTAR